MKRADEKCVPIRRQIQRISSSHIQRVEEISFSLPGSAQFVHLYIGGKR